MARGEVDSRGMVVKLASSSYNFFTMKLARFFPPPFPTVYKEALVYEALIPLYTIRFFPPNTFLLFA
jgi:hypothetical protein